MTLEIALSVLGSGFRVASNDPRMTELVRQLWEPFVSEPAPDALPLTIEAADGHWVFDGPPSYRGRTADPWLAASTLRNFVSGHAIRAASSIVPLHGAAVERDGTFLVLLAPPKAGKTTLLLDLLERGWLLVTDDLVPFDPRRLTAAPFPKPLSVRDPVRWARAAKGWSVPEWLPPPSAIGLIPATAVPGSGVGEYRPTLVVFPRYEEGAEPRLERLTPAQTVARCADNLHSREPGVPGVLPAVARMGRTTPGFAIEYGSSTDAVDLLRKCLAGPSPME